MNGWSAGSEILGEELGLGETGIGILTGPGLGEGPPGGGGTPLGVGTTGLVVGAGLGVGFTIEGIESTP